MGPADKIDAITDPACRAVVDELMKRIQIARHKAVEIIQAPWKHGKRRQKGHLRSGDADRVRAGGETAIA